MSDDKATDELIETIRFQHRVAAAIEILRGEGHPVLADEVHRMRDLYIERGRELASERRTSMHFARMFDSQTSHIKRVLDAAALARLRATILLNDGIDPGGAVTQKHVAHINGVLEAVDDLDDAVRVYVDTEPKFDQVGRARVEVVHVFAGTPERAEEITRAIEAGKPVMFEHGESVHVRASYGSENDERSG